MCGIAGIFSFKSPTDDLVRERIGRMSQALAHRGPDACGTFFNGNIALAHTRLSIIDLASCSNQPFHGGGGRYTIVFNGEIYNYRSLRDELSGYPFLASGDTEVIVAAFARWGPDCVNRLEGMFAFAIWDNATGELFLARDRMGVKPLYYYQSDEYFVFASEMRALLASGIVPRRVDLLAASEFLQYQSVSYPSTIVCDVSMLDAATWMVVDASGKLVHRYWDVLSRDTSPDRMDRPAIKKKIHSLLSASVQQRMVSDVPVAAFLSGGIDSTVVVGLMAEISSAPVNTFTIGFDEKDFDESAYARLVSKKFGTNHQQVRLVADSFLDQLVPALDAMDSPSGDGVNSYVVSNAIKQTGIKVALSGVGGDELFAGYPVFFHYLKLSRFRKWWKISRHARRLSARAVAGSTSKGDRFKQILTAEQPAIGGWYPAFRQIVSKGTMQKCTSLDPDVLYPGKGLLNDNENSLADFPLLSQVSLAEYFGYTQHTLLRDMDQMSMAASIEIREPFFDHHLVSFVLGISDTFKYPSFPKQLLVESVPGLIPDEIVHRKKQGFLLPWQQWMKNELRHFCDEYLQRIAARDFIHRNELLNLWRRFLKNDPSVRWMEVWLFVVLEYWLEKNNVE